MNWEKTTKQNIDDIYSIVLIFYTLFNIFINRFYTIVKSGINKSYCGDNEYEEYKECGDFLSFLRSKITFYYFIIILGFFIFVLNKRIEYNIDTTIHSDSILVWKFTCINMIFPILFSTIYKPVIFYNNMSLASMLIGYNSNIPIWFNYMNQHHPNWWNEISINTIIFFLFFEVLLGVILFLGLFYGIKKILKTIFYQSNDYIPVGQVIESNV